MRWLLLSLGLVMGAGYTWIGVFGTGVLTYRQWPGLLAFALAGILFAIYRPSQRVREHGARLPAVCSASALVLAGYVILRALQGPVFETSRLDVLLAFVLLLVFFAFGVAVTGWKHRFAGLWLIMALGAANSLVAFYQKFVDESFSVVGVRAGSDGLVGGLFNLHPHLAGFLEIPILLGLAYVLFSDRAAIKKVVMVLIVALCVAALAISGSRGGIFAMVAGLLCLGA